MASKPRVPGPRVNLPLGLWHYFALLLQLLTWASICSVFLLAATNTFLRFIHFKFGSHYGEYVDAASEMTQKTLVDDENRDTFIYMHSTKWFNLQSPGGRKSALCHILAMVRWHDERNTILFPVVDDSSGPEDDSDLSMEDHSD